MSPDRAPYAGTGPDLTLATGRELSPLPVAA